MLLQLLGVILQLRMRIRACKPIKFFLKHDDVFKNSTEWVDTRSQSHEVHSQTRFLMNRVSSLTRFGSA